MKTKVYYISVRFMIRPDKDGQRCGNCDHKAYGPHCYLFGDLEWDLSRNYKRHKNCISKQEVEEVEV